MLEDQLENVALAYWDIKPNTQTVSKDGPMDGNNISVVIPHANRYKNLFSALNSLAEQKTKPKLVVVSDFSKNLKESQKIKDYEGHLNIKFVHFNKAPFVRGKAINFGRKFITTTLMFIHDADIVLQTNAIDQILKTFGNPPKNLLLGFRGKNQRKNGKLVPNKATFNQVYGAFMVMKTTTFDGVGGHNPFMKGWGWQDVDLRNRLIEKGKCKEIVLKDSYTHLWHPPSVNPITDGSNREIANKSVWNGNEWSLL